MNELQSCMEEEMAPHELGYSEMELVCWKSMFILLNAMCLLVTAAALLNELVFWLCCYS